MWRKSGTKLQGRYPATPSGGFMLGLDEFVYLAKSNLNLTIWLVQMHSKLASLVRNNIWTCQIVKFALDFAKNKNPSRPSINPPVGVAGSVLIYIRLFAPQIVLMEDTYWVKITMIGWQPEDFVTSLLDDVIHFVARFFCCLCLCQEPKIFP